MRSLAVALFLVASACSPELAPDAVGTTQEGVGFWHYSYGCELGCSTSLGTDVNRTCFLGGLDGNINTSGDDGEVSGANVEDVGGSWILTVYSLFEPVNADAFCVSTALNRTPEYLETGTQSVTIPGGTAQRHCFLSEVINHKKFGFSNDAGFAEVYKGTNGVWNLFGYQPLYNSLAADDVVGARCVDVPTEVTSTFVQGPATTNLASGAGGTVACGMTGLGGAFTTNSYADGAEAKWIDASSEWQAQVEDTKRLWTDCVK